MTPDDEVRRNTDEQGLQQALAQAHERFGRGEHALQRRKDVEARPVELENLGGPQLAHLQPRRIAEDVLTAYRESRKVLVLTEWTDHLTLLREELGDDVAHCYILHGRLSKKQRTAVFAEMDALNESRARRTPSSPIQPFQDGPRRCHISEAESPMRRPSSVVTS